MDLKTALSKIGIPVGTRTVDEIVGTFTKAIADLAARDEAIVSERIDIMDAQAELREEDEALQTELTRARLIRENLSKIVGV